MVETALKYQANQLIPAHLQESNIKIITVLCVEIPQASQTPKYLNYLQQHCPLQNQKIDITVDDTVDEDSYLFGKYCEKQDNQFVNLSHLKRVRNVDGKVQILIGTRNMFDLIKDLL